MIFRVTPHHKNVARAVLKEPKIYFFDVGLVIGDEGLRFENLIALHLLKHQHFLEDTEGVSGSVHYIRDRQGHEVDFYIPDPHNPSTGTLVEVKLSRSAPSRNLSYFFERVPNQRATQVVLHEDRTLEFGKIRSLPARDFLMTLGC